MGVAGPLYLYIFALDSCRLVQTILDVYLDLGRVSCQYKTMYIARVCLLRTVRFSGQRSEASRNSRW